MPRRTLQLGIVNEKRLRRDLRRRERGRWGQWPGPAGACSSGMLLPMMRPLVICPHHLSQPLLSLVRPLSSVDFTSSFNHLARFVKHISAWRPPAQLEGNHPFSHGTNKQTNEDKTTGLFEDLRLEIFASPCIIIDGPQRTLRLKMFVHVLYQRWPSQISTMKTWWTGSLRTSDFCNSIVLYHRDISNEDNMEGLSKNFCKSMGYTIAIIGSLQKYLKWR